MKSPELVIIVDVRTSFPNIRRDVEVSSRQESEARGAAALERAQKEAREREERMATGHQQTLASKVGAASEACFASASETFLGRLPTLPDTAAHSPIDNETCIAILDRIIWKCCKKQAVWLRRSCLLHISGAQVCSWLALYRKDCRLYSAWHHGSRALPGGRAGE
jgi:hypothetical protein